jgi:two-component system NarL family sensor kinase
LFTDQAGEFTAWIGADGRLLHGNPSICGALGYSQEEFSALHMWDVSQGTVENWPARWEDLKHGQTLIAELHTKTGETVPTRFDVNYATLSGGEFVLCRGHDLREHQASAEDAAAATFAAANVDAIFMLHEGQVVDCNRGGPKLFGCSRQLMIGDLESMLHESVALREALLGEEVTLDWHSQRPDGSRLNIECTLCRIEIAGKVCLLAVAVDVTARRKTERTLAQLSGRLLEMQDEERRRIARELHDNTGQNLGALSINLSMILAADTNLNPRVREALEESIALADSCVREIRTMSYLLHPPLLDELGLVSALRAYSDSYSERTGVVLELDFPAEMPRLPHPVEIALFRIVQEGLSNIHRHSGSDAATLRVTYQTDRVELEVIDYGRGLPPGTLEWGLKSGSRGGVGIAGMRERARQLGGRLIISSGETGTTIRVALPLLHPQQLDASVGSS